MPPTSAKSWTYDVLDFRPVKHEFLSPARFLSLGPKEKANIAEVRIRPPKLGRPDFGGFVTYFRQPVYVAVTPRGDE